MEVPQFAALPPECAQTCRTFLVGFNLDMQISAKALADDPEGIPDNAQQREVILRGVALRLQGSLVKNILHDPELSDGRSLINVESSISVTDPVAAINDMDACPKRGCKILRTSLLLSLIEHGDITAVDDKEA